MTDHVRRITELTRQLVERPLTAEEQRARDLREAGERAVADAIAAQVGMTSTPPEPPKCSPLDLPGDPLLVDVWAPYCDECLAALGTVMQQHPATAEPCRCVQCRQDRPRGTFVLYGRQMLCSPDRPSSTEIERLRAEVNRANRIGDKYREMYRAAESRLAAATALVQRVDPWQPIVLIRVRLLALLANQPAAPALPPLNLVEDRTPEQLAADGDAEPGDAARTEDNPLYALWERQRAEQVVLDAMAEVSAGNLRNFATDEDPFYRESEWCRPARAELARRLMIKGE